MAAPNPPIELYFVHPIYARGEHIIGKNALTEDGKVNMVRIGRGEVVRMSPDAAKDLIIAKQAIDNRNAKPTDREEAKAFVEECKQREDEMRKKHSENVAADADLKTQVAQLKKEVEALRKKAA